MEITRGAVCRDPDRAIASGLQVSHTLLCRSRTKTECIRNSTSVSVSRWRAIFMTPGHAYFQPGLSGSIQPVRGDFNPATTTAIRTIYQTNPLRCRQCSAVPDIAQSVRHCVTALQTRGSAGRSLHFCLPPLPCGRDPFVSPATRPCKKKRAQQSSIPGSREPKK